MTDDAYAAAQASAAKLALVSGQPAHDVAVVLGSGWLPAADALGAPAAEFPLAELGGFAQPAVAGHMPVARSALLGPLRVLVYLGRTHLYEGHPVDAVVHGVRTAVAAGCRVIVLTNASGGINEGYRVGQPVLLSDHLNLTGRSPLTGPEPPAGYASRFVDLTTLYSPRLRALARRAEPGLAEGVYAALHGPHYETPAEIRMLRGAGADMVGMSTALEAIAARHLGAEVLGISLITNPAAGLSASGLNHAEVIAAGRESAAQVGALLARILPGVAADADADPGCGPDHSGGPA
ncbi:MAG TPA: purine-nucleoside phosphorylase [Streptosporangiaceae bacterium]|nr:purine-nucleoside phosphorylase [Streptosporangiaceae bacterium]